MIKKILAITIGIAAIMQPPAESVGSSHAVVDRIEGDFAVVEFSKGERVKMLNIPVEDINGNVSEGAKISVAAVDGKFYGDTVCWDSEGVKDIYYQFKSDDNTVWWILTADDIGHIPNNADKYTLYFTENGTTKGNYVCDCLPEWNCECYLYDDIFFDIENKEQAIK